MRLFRPRRKAPAGPPALGTVSFMMLNPGGFTGIVEGGGMAVAASVTLNLASDGSTIAFVEREGEATTVSIPAEVARCEPTYQLAWAAAQMPGRPADDRRE